MRKPLKTVLITVVGLVCGAALVLVAYNTILHGTAFGVPGAGTPSIASGTMPGVFADNVAAPDRLVIPAIGVDAHVKTVGVDANGDMATPGNATDVAWYKGGPYPGKPGSAVIDGHLNTKTVPQAIFYNLDKLKTGDELQVRTVDGQTLTFKVTEVKQYAENSSTQDIFVSSDGKSHLNLITCAGDWVPEKHIYTQRLVVFTERVQ